MRVIIIALYHLAIYSINVSFTSVFLVRAALPSFFIGGLALYQESVVVQQ